MCRWVTVSVYKSISWFGVTVSIFCRPSASVFLEPSSANVFLEPSFDSGKTYANPLCTLDVGIAP